MGKRCKQCQTLFFWGSKITADGDCSCEIKRCLVPGRKAMTNLDSIIKKQSHYFANKGPSSQSYDFSRGHLWMWELDHKESWVLKNQCFWTVVLKNLESPLDCREIKPINPEGNQYWILIGRTDAETAIFFFFWLTSFSIILQVHPWCCKWQNFVLFYNWVVFHWQRHYFANKSLSRQGYGFSSGHVWMWELDCEEGWAPKNWWFWTMVLEKTWESLGLQGDPTSPS